MSVYDYDCPDLGLDAGGLRERHPPPPTPSVLFRGPRADRREGREDAPHTEMRHKPHM